MSKRYTNTESSYRPSIYNNPPSDYIPPPSKQSWNDYPDYNNQPNDNYYNNMNGDITNAYKKQNRPNGDIPMNTISIDNGYPDDKTYSKYNSYNPNLQNSTNYTYSTQNVNAFPNKYNAPRVPLADPQTPKEKTQRKIVLIWTLAASILLITPVIVGYIIGQAIIRTTLWTLGFYGLVIVIHYIIQAIFAYLNYRKVTKKKNRRRKDWTGLSTGLLVVGYREDPELFRGCLKSITYLRYAKNERIIVVVDGNEEEDRYMGDIFSKVFSRWDHRVITTDFRLQDIEMFEQRAIKLVEEVKKCMGPVCIMQPHFGKRAAMYTGFQVLLQCQVEAVVVTDSDTILDTHCIKELAFMLDDNFVGAATGDVRIWNTGTMLSFLSSLRYWFAFNMERSAQSFQNCVTCVSGPLGIYRTDVLREIIDKWINQRFLGSLCTYGDDRHLTNLTLALGRYVKFTPYAFCYTETPETFIRWVTQQTRWSKSFYREALFAIKAIPVQSLWMTYEILFHIIYPFILIYSLLLLIYKGTLWQLITWILTLFIMGAFRSLFALIYTRKFKFVFNIFYGVVYLIGFIPAKIQALLFLWDNGWGTSSRLKKISNWNQKLIPILWVIVLIVGIVINIRRFIVSDTEKFEIYHIIGLIILVCTLLVGFICYNFYQDHEKKKRVAREQERRKINRDQNFSKYHSYIETDMGVPFNNMQDQY
ncbi:hypothetical protein BCR32DRAFT_230492 [Anaeromyces robustus]|uniref:Hyaluronan synthase n=1 Tax=Anaeromyces robustus TaxID=1754192 RepID=A0A1Y1XFA1_9FUNG|nr:hypothetical protein BCR32DRAFT_230492 [Anaeromyces robustus]|eukprot:ORX84397.1 hypothetical protein BCR32DRAFT_230492 [Anaeromyces robustus]